MSTSEKTGKSAARVGVKTTTSAIRNSTSGIASGTKRHSSTSEKGILALRDRYREQYREQGTVIGELIDFIIEHPYLTEPQAVESLGRSQPAVNQAIRRLWDEGILRETTGQQRHRRYEAPAVLEIVEPHNP